MARDCRAVGRASQHSNRGNKQEEIPGSTASAPEMLPQVSSEGNFGYYNPSQLFDPQNPLGDPVTPRVPGHLYSTPMGILPTWGFPTHTAARADSRLSSRAIQSAPGTPGNSKNNNNDVADMRLPEDNKEFDTGVVTKSYEGLRLIFTFSHDRFHWFIDYSLHTFST